MGGGAVDLHSHTTASDGALAPRELVELAWRHGVRVLAITDHDTHRGARRGAGRRDPRQGSRSCPGSRSTATWRAARSTSSATASSYEAAWFQDFLREPSGPSASRACIAIAARLAELGMPIDAAEVFALVKEGSPGRPHVAQVMVARGHVKSMREAFDRYLRAGGPAHVPRKRLTPVEAVGHHPPGGRRAGARASRGGRQGRHDSRADRGGPAGDRVLLRASTPPPSGPAYLEICQRHDLVATGGSDFHGVQTGRLNPPGTPAVPMAAWESLRERMARARAA